MMHEPYILNSSSRVSFIFKVLLILGVLVLFTRLSELQIIKGEYYRTLSDGNRIRSVPVVAARGHILARGGEILADNTPVRKVVQFDPKKGYTKTEITDSSEPDQISEWERTYPSASSSAHVTGYVSEVSEQEIGKPNPSCPDRGIRGSGSFVGKTGLESQYDCLLRGIDGQELFEVDIEGRKVRTLGQRAAIAGADLHTTIDFRLQKVLSESFGELIGAGVVTDLQGQVLALYSNPSFDPNSLESKYFTDPKLPLFNRAISGGYHPGSLFKIITSSAALEDGKITPDFKYTDTGTVNVNGYTYGTWYFSQYGRTEGEIDVVRALTRSTDTFFYVVGQMVGIDRLVWWADKFGLGKRTGIDIPAETAGLLPSPEWKQKTLGERWYLGNTYHFSIGQEDTLTTPLQENMITVAAANGGYLCTPTLTFDKRTNCERLPVSESSLSIIKDGMIGACSSGGTAFPFFDFSPRAACKTGTAETGEKSPTHAWFTVYAPTDKPEIVMTVLVEKGGQGSEVAAPIARRVFNYWFHERSLLDPS